MTAQLPLHLKKLEPLPSALDILRYLGSLNGVAVDAEDICAALNISQIRFSKAIKRLVTTRYLNMKSNRTYELTELGRESVEELRVYDAEADSRGDYGGMIRREAFLALPRTLTSGKVSPLLVGIAPDPKARLNGITDLVLRISALYADLSSGDELIQLGNGASRLALEVTPQAYNQARIKLQVFQLAPDGEDLTNCGGMYVDVDVTEAQGKDEMIAYSAPIEIKPI
ncbi:MAG: winged helix DNA-binding protein [Anaerolineae bacterium]|nr:winged helix DNA-binding protein [Anaerolineae bacterium]